VTWTGWLPASGVRRPRLLGLRRERVQSLPDVDLARLGLLGDRNANSQHAVVQVTIRPEQPLFNSDHQARIRPSQRLSRSAPITSSGNSMTATNA
jgi:hypothetical protein